MTESAATPTLDDQRRPETMGMEISLPAGLLLEASVFAICAGTEDKREGTAAFLEKRKAHFQGR